MTGTILDSVESAFQSLIISVFGNGLAVYTGKASSNKVLPCVICAADGSDVQEDPPLTGNYWVNVEISFKHTAATEPTDQVDPRTDDIQQMKAVFDVLRTNDLPTSLNAQGQDLTVFFPVEFSTMKSGRDEFGIWVDMLPIRLYCCPSVIPA